VLFTSQQGSVASRAAVEAKNYGKRRMIIPNVVVPSKSHVVEHAMRQCGLACSASLF
jgi:hypothetical protein